MGLCQDSELVFTEWIVKRLTFSGYCGTRITILPSYLLINLNKKAIASVQMTTKITSAGKCAEVDTFFAWRLDSDLDQHGICTTLELAKQSVENALISNGYRKLEDKLRIML